jgi:hypothetical protein
MADDPRREEEQVEVRWDEAAGVEASEPKSIEKHRSYVTFWLLGILSVLFLGHYLAVIVMIWNDKKADLLDKAFTNALPVVSGLLGTAVGYYFAREKDSN